VKEGEFRRKGKIVLKATRRNDASWEEGASSYKHNRGSTEDNNGKPMLLGTRRREKKLGE